MAKKRKLAFQISYVTITYRSVFFAILALFALFVIVMYFAFPETGNRWLQASEASLGKILAKIGLGGTKGPVGIDPGPQQAHFTNIDGTVRVKKVSTNKWITADYNVALEKGDVVQTASEGIAKIVLTDGTNYTVKPDSLIVVQENSVNSAQQTSVAVQVTTGTVDLATSTVSQGSKSQVTVAGATATLASDTTAQATNDVGHDSHEILLKKGSGEVNRNGETVKLANYEKVTFKNDSPNLIKTKVLSQVVDTTQIKLNGLREGSYYWEVQSVGENGKESVASDKNRVTVIPKGADNVNITLELEPMIQHGHVIEIRGKTEPNARVMVNGQEVAVIASDGKFYHFTNPLPTGMNVITITAQNRKGGVNTKTQPVVIQ